jgi:hypothetical protein
MTCRKIITLFLPELDEDAALRPTVQISGCCEFEPDQATLKLKSLAKKYCDIVVLSLSF